MCLACEMDAWWFAEMEAAALQAGAAPTPPAREAAGEGTPARNDVLPSVLWSAPSDRPQLGPVGEPTSPPLRVTQGFVCEETRSE